MLDFRHLRQQWAVGKGFFHTAMVVENNTTYRYIYDCGGCTKDTVNKKIAQYQTNEELEGRSNEIDMLIISHFHSDHINGLVDLFKKFKIKKLVIPYLHDDAKITAFAQLVANDSDNWQQLSGLIISPGQWLNEQNPDAQLFQISNEDNSDNNAEIPANGISLGNPGIRNHSSLGKIVSNNNEFWHFKFYVLESKSLINKIVPSLLKEFSMTKEELQEKLTDSSWIKNNLEKIKEVYKHECKGCDVNITTLCMYSGPVNSFHLHRYSSSLQRCACKQYWHFYHWDILGWLGTGDAKLKDAHDFTNFETHFNMQLQRTDTITIPHHGSKGDYNSRLGDFGLQHIITANHVIDPKGKHPATDVRLNLRTKSHCMHVVTTEDSTEVFEHFKGHLEI
jgi:hypothetical protein